MRIRVVALRGEVSFELTLGTVRIRRSIGTASFGTGHCFSLARETFTFTVIATSRLVAAAEAVGSVTLPRARFPEFRLAGWRETGTSTLRFMRRKRRWRGFLSPSEESSYRDNFFRPRRARFCQSSQD